MHDSIKYIYPVYAKDAQRGAFDLADGNANATFGMDNRFDNGYDNYYANADYKAMYESSEYRYATELVNVDTAKIAYDNGAKKLTIKFVGGAFGAKSADYIPGYSTIYVTVGGKRVAIATEKPNYGHGEENQWFKADAMSFGATGMDLAVASVTPSMEADGVQVVVTFTTVPTASVLTKDNFSAVGRFNSEKDLTGKYLGEVELQMKDYHFRPRPIALGVTWTQLTELVLDTSFGVSAEEMLMDSAAQEIKKTLDYDAIAYGQKMQRVFASANTTTFDATPADGGSAGIKDSYFHTAQLIEQSIDRVSDKIYNQIKRGGVSCLIGGPAAVAYLKLNKAWSDRGKQEMVGAYKAGELNGITVVKVSSDVVADDTLLTTWKNPQNESDVSIAVGTLIPFYSTGKLPRKNLYSEAAVARYEDTQCLNPIYLGRIEIQNNRYAN